MSVLRPLPPSVSSKLGTDEEGSAMQLQLDMLVNETERAAATILALEQERVILTTHTPKKSLNSRSLIPLPLFFFVIVI